MKSWTSPRVKGVVSDLESVYSPGRRRKKNAMMIMSATARSKWLSAGRASAISHNRRMTAMGMGFTLCGGGSSLVHAANMRWMRKSVLKAEFRRGSSLPMDKNVCATDRR